MDEIRTRIENLLAESATSAEQREQTAFARALQQADGTVVILGAGRLGRICARALRRGSVPFRGFCDGDISLHGAVIEGAEVISPREAATRFGASALFVVAIWTGTAKESMVARINWLHQLGCVQVLAYPALLWAYGREETPFHSFDLPSRMLVAAAEIRTFASFLADIRSLRVLECALAQRLQGGFADEPSDPDQYFPTEVMPLGRRECVVDGGAFDGDTLAAFLTRVKGKFIEYHAFEPDVQNAERLRARVAQLAVEGKIFVHEAALHSERMELRFEERGEPTSQVSGAGGRYVSAVALDDVMSDRQVTLLKLDVEGAERDALAGAQRLLRRQRPKVAVCVYHGPQDLWEIPRWLDRTVPGSRFFLRQHGLDGWEMVCYMLPE